MSDFNFYRCAVCGRYIPPGRMKKVAIEKSKGIVCKCGSSKISPTNVPLWIEILYLIFYPSLIKKTILWPGNRRKWAENERD